MNNELLAAATNTISRWSMSGPSKQAANRRSNPSAERTPLDDAWDMIESGEIVAGLNAARVHLLSFHMDGAVRTIDAALNS